MSFLKPTVAAMILTTGLLTLSACQEKDEDIVIDAQYCLDGARDAVAAQACISKLDGIHSEAAYVLRCSADFIGQGFGDPEQLSQALDQLQNPSGGASGTEAFLSFMVFDSVANANSTFNNCVASKQKGLSMLGAMAKAATNVASLGLGLGPNISTNLTPAQIDTAITNLINSGDADLVIGETISTIYETTCASGGAVNADMCKPLTDALATLGPNPTAEAIGAAILAEWATQ